MIPARQFITAGNATFTLESKLSGTHLTFKVQASDKAPIHFVKVLTGADNESDYSFLGTIFEDGTFRHGRRSSIGTDAPSALAFAWLWRNVDKLADYAHAAFHHEGKCCRCGRKLTVPESIESGIGPECAKMGA